MESMTLLVLGLVLFIGVHLVPTAPAFRATIAGRLGEGPYKGLFALVSAAGLVIAYLVMHFHARLFDTAPVV